MIRVRNLTKSYNVSGSRHYVFRDLDFDLPERCNVGIVGPNGAGKTTLLRILGGIDYPDTGTVQTPNSVSFPLGIRGGFINHLTGRQNCKMICRIYGLELETIREKLEYIKIISGIGKYFEEPVAYYSTGMGGRLGFALSMAFDFDYLLIDEITAVGDAHFKSLAKELIVEKVKRSSVIMVTHSMQDLKTFCSQVILIRDKKMQYFEDVEKAIEAYIPQTSVDGAAKKIIDEKVDLNNSSITNESVPEGLQKIISQINFRKHSIQEKLASKAYLIKGDEFHFYAMLSAAFSQLGERPAAKAFAEKSLSLNTFNPLLYALLANIYVFYNDFEKEGESLSKGIKLDPTHSGLNQAYAQRAMRLRDYDAAEKALLTGLSVNPKNAGLWNALAKLKMLTDDFNEALQAQLKAIKFQDNNPNFYMQLNFIFASLNDHVGAAKARIKASKLPLPPDPFIHYTNILNNLELLDERIDYAVAPIPT